MQTHWRLAKNAAANLVKGGSAGVVALLVPAALVRHMTQVEYSVWVLVLQVAAYCAYLEFGLQTAVGRSIATAHERQDADERDAVYSTALVGLCLAAALAMMLLAVAIAGAEYLFPTVPLELLTQMRWALLIVGFSVALGLPSSAWSGVFLGLERNEFIAIVTGGSRLLSATGLVMAALAGASIVRMAVVVGTVNLGSYVLLYGCVRKFSAARLRLQLVRRAVARELFDYCFSLMIWSFSMLLINGLDLMLVGRFELKALAPYAIATTVVTFITGMQSAIFSAIMPHAAVLHARRNAAALGRMVLSSTQLSVVLLVLTGMPLMIYAGPLLRLWVGEIYAVQAHRLLAVLLIANILRLFGLPYATVLLACGQQRRVTVSPLMEGCSNVFASVLLGIRFGALGVAAGTLIGATVGMLGHIFYNMARTMDCIRLNNRNFVLSALILPMLATTPLGWLAVSSCIYSDPKPLIFTAALLASLLFSAALVLRSRSQVWAAN